MTDQCDAFLTLLPSELTGVHGTHTMHLRTARASDALPIAMLHTENWRDTYRGILADRYLDGDLLSERLGLWTERFAVEGPSQHVILAEAGDELIGFACAYGAHDPEHGTLLDNLHVRRTHRGAGLGVLLLRAIARWSLEKHPNLPLHLWALEQNTHARRFYAHWGAAVSGTDHWSPPVGDPVPELRYTWADPRALTDRPTPR